MALGKLLSFWYLGLTDLYPSVDDPNDFVALQLLVHIRCSGVL
jgi:hypothetical protein